MPELLRRSAAGYWCYWHGVGGYSGVALLVRHSFFTERPGFTHPSFDRENRIVVAELGSMIVASVYVPNGGKDYRRSCSFSTGLSTWAAETQQGRPGATHLWGLERRPRGARRAPEGAQAESDRHPAGGARAGLPGSCRTDWWTSGARSILTTMSCLLGGRLGGTCANATSVGASTTCWRAVPWQRRLRRRVSMREFGTSDHAPQVVTFDT